MVKWAMEALDVYTLNTTPGHQSGSPGITAQTGSTLGGPRTQPLQQTVRTKEEKEVRKESIYEKEHDMIC